MLTSVATLAMSAAIFTRRAKTGWLDELDGIRGDALARPGGGVDEAMADPDADGADEADVVDDVDAEQASSPLTALEAPLPPSPGTSSPLEFDPTLPPPPPAAAVPSPHPSRPEEMWHPGIDLGQAISELPPPPPLQPVADGSEPDDGESPPDPPAESSGRFSFARLRAVLPNPDPNEPARSDSPLGPGEDRPSLLSELVAPYATPEVADQPVGGPEEFWPPVEEGQVPVVPPTAVPSGQSLISGPVQRRSDNAEPDRRRGLPPVVAVDHPAPTAEPVDAPLTQDPEPALEPEPSAQFTDVSQPEPAEVEPEAVEAEPEPEPEPVGPKSLEVEADNTVRLTDGHLRFAQHPGGAPLLDVDGVEATLSAGWCWVSTGASQPDRVSVRLSSLTLRVGPSSTALVAVEGDGSTFVVIAAGEATLEHPATRLHLRRGAMALTASGSEPQADMATDEEIASDPLVAENRRLDLTR